jgi:uncharacterized membrane protein
MRRLIQTVAPILLIAAAVHAATVLAIPRLVMWRVMRAVAARSLPNTPYHAPPVTAAARTIPLPSPDLLYSTCALDLSAGPIAVSVAPGPDYLSLAVFDARTDNVFVTNNQAAATAAMRLLVAGPGTSAAPAGYTLVHLATTRGLLLLRGLAATPEAAHRNDLARRTLSCLPRK